MDNLTHSLVGALVGQMGLKRKTGLAMPTLIIAANIPDIDAVTVLLGGHQHLAIRRGITHGPIAMVLLPLLLWGAMLAYAKWRPNVVRLPIHKGWLLALAFIGCLSHPLFDWFNSYCVRLFKPFSNHWFYGDTLFIIDVWIWAALIAGVWLSLRRERSGATNWRAPAVASFAAICAYILANGFITERAEALTTVAVERQHNIVPYLVVANPVPVQFWKRNMLWRSGFLYGSGTYSLARGLKLENRAKRHNAEAWVFNATPDETRDFNAFLVWTRMPVFERRGDRLILTDQRFNDEFTKDRFKVEVEAVDQ